MSFRYLAVLSLTVAAPAFGAAAKADIPTEGERAPVVELAASLSHPVDSAPLPGNVKSPFAYDAAVAADPSNPGAAKQSGGSQATRTTLEEMANFIVSQRPNYVELRGTRFIQIGQKRYAVGDKIPVKMATGDKVLDIEVSDIPNATTYILKYNGETTTRSTKAR